jgi:glutathione peroxidase
MLFLILKTTHTMSKLPATLSVLFLLALGGVAPAMAQSPAQPAAATAPAAPAAPAACPAILKQTFNRLQDETPQNLCQYAGKVILVVNTASYCGYTNQYEGLEAMYAKYGSKGLVVLGFPSNDFGKQEPGNSKEIADFCYNTYGVKFPMFSKSVVSGSTPNPLFANLIKITGKAPAWNFHKYLIDRNGKVIDNFASKVTPTDKQLVGEVEKALAM